MELFKTKKLKLADKEVVLKELSVGLIYQVDEDIKKDDIKTILKECSNLSDDEINALGISVANALYDEILSLTYGEVKKGESSKKK